MQSPNDILRGNGGSDLLDGDEDADLMIGGTGNDIYRVDNPDDRVVEYRCSVGDRVYEQADEGDYDRITTYFDNYLLADNIKAVFLLPQPFFLTATDSNKGTLDN